MASTDAPIDRGAPHPTDFADIQEALDEIRAEASAWRIRWIDDGSTWSRTTSLAWIVYCARRDPDATVEPLQ